MDRKNKTLQIVLSIFGAVSLVVAVATLLSSNRDSQDQAMPLAEGLKAIPPPYHSITAEEAKRRLNSGERVALLDVRTPDENAEKRIPGSLLIPLDKPEEMSKLANRLIPDKTTPIFIYCRSGRRSITASLIMHNLGYTNIYNLGGIIDWPYETESRQ